MAVDCNVASSLPQTVPFDMTGNRAPRIGSERTAICWDGNIPKPSGKIYPYKFNIIGNITTQYDSNGDLIATLSGVHIVPSGADDTRGTGPHKAPWYGSTTSNVAAWRAMAIALVVTPNANPPSIPAENSPAWHKCLGGWYAAGVTCAPTCSPYGNPPGGTRYVWNDYNGNGARFAKTQGQTGGRIIPDQTWNLGKIKYGNGVVPHVWIIAYPQQAVTNSDPNCNIPFYAKSFVSGVSVTVQMLQICPPSFKDTGQTPDVCNDCVNTILKFNATEFGGIGDATIEVEYKYAGQAWNQAMRTQEIVHENQAHEVDLGCLIHSKTVEWRARYTVAGASEAKSEYTYGSFDTLFIPPSDMVVPDIDEQECTTLTQGKLVPEFDHLTNYWREDL